MTPTAKRHTHLQAIARRCLLAACTVLLLGVMGAAASKVDARRHQPVVSLPAGPLLAAANIDPIPTPVHRTPAEPRPATSTRRTLLMEVTAYCPCTLCCGPNAQGITASGKHVSYNDGRFVAADTSLLPFGTRLIVPGYADNQPVEVIDRGGAIKGHKLDLYFDSHEDALQWGRQFVEVTLAD